MADFTAQTIAELNRAGVYDPAERSRIIAERTAEARRTGALPTYTGSGAGGATSGPLRKVRA